MKNYDPIGDFSFHLEWPYELAVIEQIGVNRKRMANFTEINGIFQDSPIKFKNTEHGSPRLDALTLY